MGGGIVREGGLLGGLLGGVVRGVGLLGGWDCRGGGGGLLGGKPWLILADL